MTTTIEPVRNRFRTLDAACEQIEKLEAQIVALNAALTAIKTAAPAKAQIPTAPANVPSANQPAAAATTPAAKSIDQMSLRELADAADAAAQSGDHAAAGRFYKAYEAKRANR